MHSSTVVIPMICLVVHVFGVLLGKSWDKVNHQQSVHVLMCSSRTWFWPWRNSNISTETPNGSCNNGIWNWCAWAAPKKLFKYYIFHKQLFSPLSQHLGHVVLLHVKDDLNKQASVVSTTCRFFLHNPKNNGISKLVVWRSRNLL